jgi:arylsulfatase
MRSHLLKSVLRNAVFAAACVAIILSFACGAGPGAGNDAKEEYNFIFISIDALRADHLGCYGYKRNTSPNIDKFARNHILFENFFTVVPKTQPSMSVFFTGKYMQDLGIVDNERAWSDSIVGLVELLPRDYAKTAFICNPGLSRIKGYRGFDMGQHVLVTQQEITGRAIEFLEGIEDGKFFLWLHYIDPHGPYKPPAEFHEMFVGDEFYDASKKISLDYIPLEGFSAHYVLGEQVAVPQYQRLGDIDEVDYYIAEYDAEIRYTDAEIGKLFAYLESKRLLENTIIVITADHGEGLGENDYFFEHGMLVNEGNIHIPLIMSHPEVREPLAITSLIQNTDLAPTLLSEIGLKFPHEIDGIDFSHLYRSRKTDEKLRNYIYSCTPWGYPYFYETIRDDMHKFIRRDPEVLTRIKVENDLGETFVDGAITDKEVHSFYDVSKGNADVDDIISSIDGDERKEYLTKLRAFGKKATPTARIAEEELPQEIRENLKALGYID